MADAEKETPFTRTCAWTGQETPGKHYVLKTTEGEELVSEKAFRGVDPDEFAELAARVAKLEAREKAARPKATEQAPARRPGRPRKATVPAQASAKE